jgi:hypothetical protein
LDGPFVRHRILTELTGHTKIVSAYEPDFKTGLTSLFSYP